MSQLQHSQKTLSASGLMLSFLLALMVLFSGYVVATDAFTDSNRDLVSLDEGVENAVKQLKAKSAEERNELVLREYDVLKANPLDASALENLSLLHDIEGKSELSSKYSSLAAERSLHNTNLQISNINTALKRQDYADAVYRLDGLIRADRSKRPEYFAVLRNIVYLPNSKPAIAELMARQPPWRTAFLQSLGNDDGRPEGVYDLFSEMRKVKSPPTDRELNSFLSYLIAAKKFEVAYFVWLDFLADNELSKTGLLFDGQFDLPLRNSFFGWTYVPRKNVELRFAQRGQPSTDRMLQISFGGGQIPFSNFSQYVRLPPGSYTLSGEAKAEDLKTTGGVIWRIYCADPLTQIGEGGRLSESQAWSVFETSFEVPAQNCDTQILRLDSASRAKLDSEISGGVFFDNLKILSQTPETP